MALRQEAGAASLPRLPGALGERRLPEYRLWFPDAVENIFNGSITYGEKIVGNLELYFSAVLV